MAAELAFMVAASISLESRVLRQADASGKLHR